MTINVYLAGPMRGIPEFNFPAFFAAEKKLTEMGYFVFNPARKDLERHGDNFAQTNKTGSLEEAAKEYGFSLRDALGIDLKWICQSADAVAVLPGWENSKGARAEVATAEALGLAIIYLGDPHGS